MSHRQLQFLKKSGSLSAVAIKSRQAAILRSFCSGSKSVEQSANKSSVFTNFQLQSFSLCPCQCSPRLLAFLVKGDGFEATTEKSSRHCCHCDTLYAGHSWGHLQCLLVHHEIVHTIRKHSNRIVLGPHKLLL